MIKIAIIDDEQAAINNIKKIIALSNLEIVVVGTAKSVKSGIELIKSTHPDLLLLDIELQDGSGFDILEAFDIVFFKLVFITASESHALKAFRYSALDYLVKPINPQDLINVIQNITESNRIEHLELQMKVLLENFNKLNQVPKKIVLKTSEAVHIINIDDIVRCEADRNYTTFFLINGNKILVSNTLKEYEKLLSENSFIRVHNSHLVNITKIRKYDKHINGCLIMSDNSCVPVSVRKKESLMHYLAKF
ncbi:MAG TPA: LytTR family DNA-binding domain-containing protein [Bacteroidales bacterium]|nr:LytTR family DNA-binding domain-containing protein [Bacteroidales bacterium]